MSFIYKFNLFAYFDKLLCKLDFNDNAIVTPNAICNVIPITLRGIYDEVRI